MIASRHLLSALLLVVTGIGGMAQAAWRIDGEVAPVRAVVESTGGSRLAVYSDPDNTVFLEFTTTARGGLTRSSCPTFQVDRRTPQHFYRPGPLCTVTGPSVRYTLARISADNVQSLVLHRLLNGNQVAFRYLALDGTYHEDVFTLSRSKQALLAALGESLTVDPGTDE